MSKSVGVGGSSATATDFDPDGAELRSDEANKMWNRLVEANRARYEQSEDRYVYLPAASTKES